MQAVYVATDCNYFTVLMLFTGSGVATGVGGEGVWVYIPPPQKKSVRVNFLWGRNDIRTAIEHEY